MKNAIKYLMNKQLYFCVFEIFIYFRDYFFIFFIL